MEAMQNDVWIRKRRIKNQVQVLLIKYLLNFSKPNEALTGIFNPSHYVFSWSTKWLTKHQQTYVLQHINI